MKRMVEQFQELSLKKKLSWCIIIASTLIIVCLSVTGRYRLNKALNSMSLANNLQQGGNLAVMTVVVRAFSWEKSLLGYRYGLSRTANVDYVISMSDVTSDNFTIRDKNNILIHLPSPTVDNTTLIPATEARDFEFRSGRMAFRSKRKISNAAVRGANDAIKATIDENNKVLVETAKISAQSVLEGLYRNVGVENVEIKWR